MMLPHDHDLSADFTFSDLIAKEVRMQFILILPFSVA